jgi:hypothetical protein
MLGESGASWPFRAGKEFLRLNAAARAIDRQADATDDRRGCFTARGSGFRPVVFDLTNAANCGVLAAIFALDGSWEHDGLGCVFCYGVSSVWRSYLGDVAETVPKSGGL